MDEIFKLDLQTIDWVAISAIGTFIIVVINLVILFVVPWCKRPKFSLTYKMSFPFCRYTMATANKEMWQKAYWIRLKVKNSGKSVAKRCIAKLTRVMDENGNEDESFDAIQLHWVSTGWERLSSSGLLLPFIDLSRDEAEYLDVLVTQLNDNQIWIGGENGILPSDVAERRQILDRLQPGKYILVVTVYGDNVRPVTKYVSLIRHGTKMEDFNLELHDNLRQAKSWLKKNIAVRDDEQQELESKNIPLENYITSQIQTYFILGITSVYLCGASGDIIGKYFYGVLAGIIFLWTFCLWMVVITLQKRIKRFGLLIKVIDGIRRRIGETCDQSIYSTASLVVLSTGFVAMYFSPIIQNFREPVQLILIGLFMLYLIGDNVFKYYILFRSKEEKI